MVGNTNITLIAQSNFLQQHYGAFHVQNFFEVFAGFLIDPNVAVAITIAKKRNILIRKSYVAAVCALFAAGKAWSK